MRKSSIPSAVPLWSSSSGSISALPKPPFPDLTKLDSQPSLRIWRSFGPSTTKVPPTKCMSKRNTSKFAPARPRTSGGKVVDLLEKGLTAFGPLTSIPPKFAFKIKRSSAVTHNFSRRYAMRLTRLLPLLAVLSMPGLVGGQTQNQSTPQSRTKNQVKDNEAEI